MPRSLTSLVLADWELSIIFSKVNRLTWLDDFAGYDVHHENLFVEVGNGDLTSGKGSQNIDVLCTEKVVAASCEEIVRFLADDEDNIAILLIRHLISSTFVFELLTSSHSAIDKDLQDLFVVIDLLALADFAFILEI